MSLTVYRADGTVKSTDATDDTAGELLPVLREQLMVQRGILVLFARLMETDIETVMEEAQALSEGSSE